MSQDQSNPTHDFDIDSVEVEILIICKNPAAFQQSASYLSRRGWPTTVIGNLSKAIDFIVKHNPDIVLISLNHPNPNTFRLPTLLTHGMNTECIAFAEVGDAGTTAKLAATNFKNKLQGLPSGPNIQRMVRRILLEAFAVRSEPDEDISFVTDPEISPKPIKLKDVGDDAIKGANYTMGRHSQRKRLKDLRPPAPEKSELLKLANERAAKGESGMMFMPSKGEGNSEEERVAYMPNQKAGESYAVVQKGKGPGELHSALQKGVSSTEFSVVQEGPEKKSDGRPQVFSVDKPLRGSKKYQALFEKSVESALAKTCVSEGGAARFLGAVDFVAALPVDSSDLHGYIIISISGVSAEHLLDLVRSFRAELMTLMAEYGIPVTTEEAFIISMESFDYLEWVKQEAALAFTTDHQGAQVGISFFATKERLPQPRESDKRDMAMIKVQEVEAEQPIPFKAYLHFKRSDRLYLYLRNGRRLYQSQKDRLLSHRVADFYIKAIDINNFKNFTASNYITRTTLKFRNKKRTG